MQRYDEHMNSFHQRRSFQPFPVSNEPVATVSGDTPTDTPAHRDMPDDAATDDATPVAATRDMSPDTATGSQDTPRQTGDIVQDERDRFTLTVEDVAIRLADENIYRDPRTIQRWCKSRKLNCLLDAENGEKYLIEPTSLEKTVATLIRDRDRHARATSRQLPDMPRNTPQQEETAPGTDATHAATDRETSRPEPDDGRDTVAAQRPTQESDGGFQARIHQLETELAMTKADKQVREQMVEYLKEQFAQMLDGALDRSEQIGELRAENAQLKNLLNAAPAPRGDNARREPPSERVE